MYPYYPTNIVHKPNCRDLTDLTVVTNMLDILIVSNRDYNFSYETEMMLITIFSDTKLLFKIFCDPNKNDKNGENDKNDKNDKNARHWKITMDYKKFDHSFTITLLNRIITIIKENYKPIDLVAVCDYCTNFANQDTNYIHQKLNLSRIPNRIVTFSDDYPDNSGDEFNFSFNFFIDIPKIFWPGHKSTAPIPMKVFSTIESFFLGKIGTTWKIFFDDNKIRSFDHHKYYDLTNIVLSRQNLIIKEQCLFFMYEFYSNQMNQDLAQIIIRLCFDLCYYDL